MYPCHGWPRDLDRLLPVQQPEINNAGDYWSLGQACNGAAAGSFRIDTSVTGHCLTISAAGVVNVPGSLSLAGSDVATQAFANSAASAAQTASTAYAINAVTRPRLTPAVASPAAAGPRSSPSPPSYQQLDQHGYVHGGVPGHPVHTLPGGTNYTVVATPIANSTSTLTVAWATVSNTVINLYVEDLSNTPQGYAVNFLVF